VENPSPVRECLPDWESRLGHWRASLEKREKWPELSEWLAAPLEAFRATFTPPIQSKEF